MRFLAEILRLVVGPVGNEQLSILSHSAELSKEDTFHGSSCDTQKQSPLIAAHFHDKSMVYLIRDLAVELGARVFRSIINQVMREVTREEQMWASITNQVTWFIGNGKQSRVFWQQTIIPSAYTVPKSHCK